MHDSTRIAPGQLLADKVRRALSSLTVAAMACMVITTPVGATTTVSGQTDGGAYYKIVVPDSWNGDLMIWNHGFSLASPGPVTGLEDEFFVQLFEGYAVAASSYRLSGWAVFKTNKDLKALVREFEAAFGTPERVILAGASLGGIVSAAALEKADLGNVVGALTYCGAMAGSRNWEAALDIRLLYDLICAGVKGAQIPDACTGVDVRRSKRTRAQKANLKRLTKLGRIPESFVQTVMWYVTLGMSDLVHDRGKLKSKIGVGNQDVDYGDEEVNRTIQRIKPKRKAARKLARRFTPKGRVGNAKIVSLHTDKDGLVFVENQGEYASVVPPENLTSAVVVEKIPTHCLFTPAEVFAAWEELRDWIDGGPQPTAADIQARCTSLKSLLGGECRIDPGYQIPPFDSRVRPR
jgi:pimeloyl-ACP methyl ester carboxylesterase